MKHKLVSLGIILLSASVLAPTAAVAHGSVDAAVDPSDDWLSADSAELVDSDPFEPANRALFGLNEILYRLVLDPLSDVYGFAVPDPGRRAVRRFFSNLSEPIVFVNQLLQGRCRRGAVTGGRFLINTTIGVAGLFDPATNWGLGRHSTGFGETLSVYSVGRGPYLVLPLLGPSTLRGAVGEVFDRFLRVDTWFLAANQRLIVTAGDGVSSYDGRRDGMEALRNSSIDFYTALRTAYLLDRAAQLRAARRTADAEGRPAQSSE